MSEASKSEACNPLPPCSIPTTCQLSIRGTPEGIEWHDAFQNMILKLIILCGRVMDLSQLDGVTVGFDYNDALDSVVNRPGFSRHSQGSLRNAFQTLPG